MLRTTLDFLHLRTSLKSVFVFGFVFRSQILILKEIFFADLISFWKFAIALCSVFALCLFLCISNDFCAATFNLQSFSTVGFHQGFGMLLWDWINYESLISFWRVDWISFISVDSFNFLRFLIRWFFAKNFLLIRFSDWIVIRIGKLWLSPMMSLITFHEVKWDVFVKERSRTESCDVSFRFFLNVLISTQRHVVFIFKKV